MYTFSEMNYIKNSINGITKTGDIKYSEYVGIVSDYQIFMDRFHNRSGDTSLIPLLYYSDMSIPIHDLSYDILSLSGRDIDELKI